MKVLADAHLEPKGIDKIILIGGMTRIPLVRKFVEDIIGITITASTKLDETTKSKMIKDAEQFMEQDHLKKEETDLRNNADSLLYTVERTMKDLGDKISKENIDLLDKDTSELRQALAGKDVHVIRTKVEQLSKVLQEVGSAAYQRASQGPKTQAGANPST